MSPRALQRLDPARLPKPGFDEQCRDSLELFAAPHDSIFSFVGVVVSCGRVMRALQRRAQSGVGDPSGTFTEFRWVELMDWKSKHSLAVQVS